MNTIDNISSELIIIVGIIMLILGLIGNILNIYVFTTWSHSRRTLNNNNANRTSNSPLYLLVSSIANLIIIIYSLSTRILFDGYQYQITQSNVFILCKLRFYTLHTCDIISLSCVCMAIFDRYLISSREVRLRQMSTTSQRTKLIILFIVCLIGLHSIPLAIYFDVSNINKCILVSIGYSYYYLFIFQILLHGFIPIIFLSVFGILTSKQLKIITRTNHIANLNYEKQLSRMLLLISIAIILSSIPYSTEQFYYVMISHNNDSQSSGIFLFHIICSLLFYINPVFSFYIFYISTPNFRQKIQKLIRCEKLIRYTVRNQVNVIEISHNLH